MQGGLVLECICSVKYGAFFTIARAFLDTRKNFHDFFWYKCVFKMKFNNFLVEFLFYWNRFDNRISIPKYSLKF